MTGSTWYLRRAVPWRPAAGCLVGAALLVAAVTRWPDTAGLFLPLVVLLGASAAGFVFDETAVRVATATPRGTRWAPLNRLYAGSGLVVLGAALAVVAAGEAGSDRSDWAGLTLAVGGVTLLTALATSRRQVPHPGSWISSTLVLLGLAPLVVGLMLGVRSPYPLEPWTDGWRAGWWLTGLIAWTVALLLVAVPNLLPARGRRQQASPDPVSAPGTRSARPPVRATGR